LKVLRASGNKLQRLNFLSHFKKLYEVDLGKNYIKAFEKGSFPIPNMISSFNVEDN
jgi:hypothetical protein